MEATGQHVSMARDQEAMLSLQRIMTDLIRQQNVPRDLGLRWMGDSSGKYRQCITDVGLFSHARGSGPTWQGDRIHNHCNEVRGDFSSEYMSFTVSPRRMINFMVWPRDDPNSEIAIIDLHLLDVMQRPRALTTDLARQFNLRLGRAEEGRTKYITDTHYLVHEHIPACCILGFITANAFRRVCHNNNLNEASDPDYTKRLTWEMLRPYTQTTSSFSVPPDFGPGPDRPHQPPQDRPRTPPPINHGLNTQFPATPRTQRSQVDTNRTPNRPRERQPAPSPTRFSPYRRPSVVDLTQPDSPHLSTAMSQVSVSQGNRPRHRDNERGEGSDDVTYLGSSSNANASPSQTRTRSHTLSPERERRSVHDVFSFRSQQRHTGSTQQQEQQQYQHQHQSQQQNQQPQRQHNPQIFFRSVTQHQSNGHQQQTQQQHQNPQQHDAQAFIWIRTPE